MTAGVAAVLMVDYGAGCLLYGRSFVAVFVL